MKYLTKIIDGYYVEDKMKQIDITSRKLFDTAEEAEIYRNKNKLDDKIKYAFGCKITNFRNIVTTIVSDNYKL